MILLGCQDTHDALHFNSGWTYVWWVHCIQIYWESSWIVIGTHISYSCLRTLWPWIALQFLISRTCWLVSSFVFRGRNFGWSESFVLTNVWGYYELVLVKYEYGVQHCLLKRSLIDLSTKSIVKLKSCKDMSLLPGLIAENVFSPTNVKILLSGAPAPEARAAEHHG